MPIPLRLTTFVAGFAAHDVAPGLKKLIYSFFGQPPHLRSLGLFATWAVM
jgi:hypothetical protein